MLVEIAEAGREEKERIVIRRRSDVLRQRIEECRSALSDSNVEVIGIKGDIRPQEYLEALRLKPFARLLAIARR